MNSVAFPDGVVRRKNVPSVMAPCLGYAGMIVVLWWAAATARVSTGAVFGGTKTASWRA